jgi:hypothetical protein
MVGSEHVVAVHPANAPNGIAVPSWSGRNLVNLTPHPINIIVSPSPHGRVGTKKLRQDELMVTLSPSPHGRVGTSIPPRPAVIMTASPSPHGRVGTCCCRPSSECPERNRRPLMVGSELLKTSTSMTAISSSPSPHGRVGTLKCQD